MNRRNFPSSAAPAFEPGTIGRANAASVPEAAIANAGKMASPLAPSASRPYNPVVTLNGLDRAFLREEQRR